MLNISVIKKVTPEAMHEIIEKRFPVGRYYTIEDGKYISCFNDDFNAWTEEHETFKDCMDNLLD